MNMYLAKPKRSEDSLFTTATIIFTSYAFSQLSWGNSIPNVIWLVILSFATVLLVLDKLIRRTKVYINSNTFLAFLMLLICFIWNNQSIKIYGWAVEKFYALQYIFFFMAVGNDKWHKPLMKLVLLFGFFYAIWTYICILLPGVYENYVYPIMAHMGYDNDTKAGFTAFYGTNGGYLSIGLFGYMGWFFFRGEKNISKTSYITALFLLVGMLLTGKRGQFIAVCLGILICYYVYNADNKGSRVLRIILMIIFALFALFIISIVLPETLTIVERFQIQSEKGDISTGRFLMWERAWKLFLQKPILGYGWRWFRYSTYTLNDYDVHNVFLQLLLEVGIIGAIPFYLFIFSNFLRAIKTVTYFSKIKKAIAPEMKYICFALMYEVFFLLMCATGTALYQVEFMFPYFCSCAIIQFYARSKPDRE